MTDYYCPLCGQQLEYRSTQWTCLHYHHYTWTAAEEAGTVEEGKLKPFPPMEVIAGQIESATTVKALARAVGFAFRFQAVLQHPTTITPVKAPPLPRRHVL